MIKLTVCSEDEEFSELRLEGFSEFGIHGWLLRGSYLTVTS